MEKRNLHAGLLVYLLMAFVVAGCASTSSSLDGEQVEQAQTDDASDTEPPQAGATTDSGPGPFEVAVDWASTMATKTPPQGLEQVVGEWKIARVARVWAAGDEYRAVVVQKNTARETLAVLLHIARVDTGDGDAGDGNTGSWQVTDTQPTISTHLWSEL